MHRQANLILLGFLAAAQVARGADANLLWTSKVQPIIEANCVKCHGPLFQKSGLELDTLDMLVKGGDDGAVVVPGKPQDSQIYKNIAPDAETHMPPKKQLSDADRESVRQWIAALTPASLLPPKPKPLRKFDSIPQAIDTLIAEGWQERKVKPATAVDDRTWCRRVYLDLAGRINTPDELKAFLDAPAKTRRAGLVDKLLAADEYAAHMRELWDVFLMGRAQAGQGGGGRGGGRGGGDARQSSGWNGFLENNFRTNRPWDEMVHAIVLARPQKPEDKGAAFLVYDKKNDYQAIAEAIAPIIYGTRVSCAQCHDHPLTHEIKQAHYWGLVAAYNRGKNIQSSTEIAESAIGGFVNFTNLKKESQPAAMALMTGEVVKEDRPPDNTKEEDSDDKYVDPKALVKIPKFSRRAALADAATHNNPLIARAFVNRMWAALLGRGIVQPPDEMNGRYAPSHPELLDWLAQDFATNHYDIKREVRGIVLSRAYALGSGERPAESFAAAIERPLTAEQLARSWRVVAGLPPNDDQLRRATVTALPEVLPREYNATYQQAQFLASSPALSGVLKSGTNSTVTRLAALPDETARIKEAFLDVDGRPPDTDEVAQAKTFLKARSGKPDEDMRELLWALMTSAEFLTMP